MRCVVIVFHVDGRLKSARITQHMNGMKISETSCIGQLQMISMQSSCSLTVRHDSAVSAYCLCLVLFQKLQVLASDTIIREQGRSPVVHEEKTRPVDEFCGWDPWFEFVSMP